MKSSPPNNTAAIGSSATMSQGYVRSSANAAVGPMMSPGNADRLNSGIAVGQVGFASSIARVDQSQHHTLDQFQSLTR